jgi:4-hydroxy-tetrahydrodipicolinate synthase
MVETVVNEANGKIPVIAGILSPGFKEATMAAEDFKKAGADAVMLVTPYYVYPSQEGMTAYFGEFVSKVGMPVVMYDIPPRTNVYLEPETIMKIVEENEMIIGIKACNTHLFHFTRMVSLVGDRISILCGEEFLFLAEVGLGAKGGILALANLFPAVWVRFFDAISRGDTKEAKRIHFALAPLLKAAFAECNPGPLKEAMPMVGFEVGHALRPLIRPSEENMARLKEAVQGILDNPL